MKENKAVYFVDSGGSEWTLSDFERGSGLKGTYVGSYFVEDRAEYDRLSPRGE